MVCAHVVGRLHAKGVLASSSQASMMAVLRAPHSPSKLAVGAGITVIQVFVRGVVPPNAKGVPVFPMLTVEAVAGTAGTMGFALVVEHLLARDALGLFLPPTGTLRPITKSRGLSSLRAVAASHPFNFRRLVVAAVVGTSETLGRVRVAVQLLAEDVLELFPRLSGPLNAITEPQPPLLLPALGAVVGTSGTMDLAHAAAPLIAVDAAARPIPTAAGTSGIMGLAHVVAHLTAADVRALRR